MTEVLLFHHALGLTDGCRSLAERLRSDGHEVHTPDLYDGNVFSELSARIAHAEQIGFDTIIERGRRAAESLPRRSCTPACRSAFCRRRCPPKRSEVHVAQP